MHPIFCTTAILYFILAIGFHEVYSTLSKFKAPQGFMVRKLGMADFPLVRSAALAEFLPQSLDFPSSLKLQFDVFYFFGQKLAFSDYGHTLFGIFDISRETFGGRDIPILAGFVDVSLQTDNGSNKETLSLTKLKLRQREYPSLQPYLCNLLVVEKYRRQGLASSMVSVVETFAKNELGGTQLNLHVDEETQPALCLYLRLGFDVVPNAKCARPILFLSKTL